MKIDSKYFKIAYKKLKSSVYYDKTQLILRDKIVSFENKCEDVDKYLDELTKKFLDQNTRDKIFEEILSSSPYLFKPYFQQYESWRDTAMNYLQMDQDVVILTIDFKRFYYSVDISKKLFDNTCEELDDECSKSEYVLALHEFMYK